MSLGTHPTEGSYWRCYISTIVFRIALQYIANIPAKTDQPEELEKVDIGVEFVLNDLQPLWGEDAHGIANSVESTAAGENEESLQQGQAAGNVL